MPLAELQLLIREALESLQGKESNSRNEVITDNAMGNVRDVGAAKGNHFAMMQSYAIDAPVCDDLCELMGCVMCSA